MPTNIREAAYRHIQRKILAGELEAGAPISEVLLAKQLGSSRTPVREAIGQLAAEGFLQQIPKRGTVVARLARHDILELYELREALEVYAVGKIALHGLDPADLEELHRLALLPLELEAGLRPGQQLDAAGMRRLMKADLAFHTLLIRSAGNGRILKVIGDTRLLMRIFAIRRQGHDGEQLAAIHRSHAAIVDAVARCAPETAARLMAQHIRTSCDERLEAFDDWQRNASVAAARRRNHT